jgi:ribosomal protein S18 acetylase RimI-like enzyme
MERLEWDSKQLGISCGLVSADTPPGDADPSTLYDRIDGLLTSHPDISFVTIKLHGGLAGVVNRLVKGRADFIDIELVYQFNGSPLAAGSSDVRFCKTFQPECFLVLSNDMNFSRFFLDRRIPENRSRALWAASIRNHCLGRSDELAVAFCGEQPVGVTTLQFKDNRIHLFLVGVLPRFRSRGIGTDLLSAVTRRYGGTHRILVETSGMNIAAQRLYQKSGFQLNHIRYILHHFQMRE